MKKYIPFDIQSSYSIGKSICTIPNLVQRASDLGLPAIALTDDGVLFGAKEFHNRCRRCIDSHGYSAPIKPILGLSIDVSVGGAFHMVRLLAKNAVGYHNLVRIASDGAMFDKPAEHRVDFQTIEKGSLGLICLTEDTDNAFVERCMSVFGDDFAFEATSDDCDFSAWPSVMVCAANPVRQVDEGDAEAFEVNRAVVAGVTLKDIAPQPCHAPRHLMSCEEMANRFPSHPEWIENTVQLAERIEEYDLNVPQEIAAPSIPQGFSFPMEYLRHLAFEGAKSRWSDPLPEEVAARLDYELSVVERRVEAGCDAASYLLVVHDYVEAARRMGVFVGPGRGSAGGSALAYALGITEVDPLKYGLLFERFLNPDKNRLPDIDIDVDESGRELVLRHLVEKYGREHVAGIATFGTDKKLCGCVRSVGIHACGVVLSPRTMTDVLPVMEHAEMPITQYDGHHVEDVGLVQFDILGLQALSEQKRCLELIRDRFGMTVDLNHIPDDDQRTLSVFARGNTEGVFQFDSDGIRKILRQLKPSRFSDLVALYVLYRPGIIEYLPQFIRRKNGEEPMAYDHPLMEGVLAETTYGIVIYQEQVMVLARRLAGFTRCESDLLRKALGKKLQSQVERLRTRFVNGCLANPEFRVGEWRDEAAARKLAEKIFRDWERFSLCAFLKSHAVCYALIAYRSAYLKAHWPEEFVLSREGSRPGTFGCEPDGFSGINPFKN